MWRVSSPTDLRCEGDLRDVEGAVSYAVEVRGGFAGRRGRRPLRIWGLWGICGTWRGDFYRDWGFAGRGGESFIGIGDLRGVEGVVPYAVEVRGGFRDVEGVVAYGFGV